MLNFSYLHEGIEDASQGELAKAKTVILVYASHYEMHEFLKKHLSLWMKTTDAFCWLVGPDDLRVARPDGDLATFSRLSKNIVDENLGQPTDGHSCIVSFSMEKAVINDASGGFYQPIAFHEAQSEIDRQKEVAKLLKEANDGHFKTPPPVLRNRLELLNTGVSILSGLLQFVR